MPDIAIRVENLSKQFFIEHHKQKDYNTLRDVIAYQVRKAFSKSSNISQSTDKSEVFWALKEITFDVLQGDVIGIIGRNGAGKSTLLKILSRITDPTNGRISICGRISSLLEVGTGFHPELTGRENIYLNGAILGMRRSDVKRQFDDIVAFSGIEKFVDTPVKRYSSGMYMRLAFSVAAHLEPEILVVDEVLAVGDAEFQKKCLGKMKDVSKSGRTVLFVSHNMTAIRSLCTKGILLNRGQLVCRGGIDACIREYLSGVGDLANEKVWSDWESSPGNDSVRINAIRALSKHEEQGLFSTEAPIDIEVEFTVTRKSKFHITLHFVTDHGIIAFSSFSSMASSWKEQPELGEYKTTCRIPGNLLNEGGYSVNLLLVEDGTRVNVALEEIIGFDVKDLTRRGVGEWQGREPGPVKPKLVWEVVAVNTLAGSSMQME